MREDAELLEDAAIAKTWKLQVELMLTGIFGVVLPVHVEAGQFLPCALWKRRELRQEFFSGRTDVCSAFKEECYDAARGMFGEAFLCMGRTKEPAHFCDDLCSS